MFFEDSAGIAIWKLFDQNNIALIVIGNEDIIVPTAGCDMETSGLIGILL
jgi:hypothetical protein